MISTIFCRRSASVKLESLLCSNCNPFIGESSFWLACAGRVGTVTGFDATTTGAGAGVGAGAGATGTGTGAETGGAGGRGDGAFTAAGALGGGGGGGGSSSLVLT